MSKKLESLFNRAEKVLDTLEAVRLENKNLRGDNARLKAELSSIEKEYKHLRLQGGDREQAVKSKLHGILDRLDQLESMAS